MGERHLASILTRERLVSVLPLCWTRTSSCPNSAFARYPSIMRPTRSAWRSAGRPLPSAISRPSRTAACLAATLTGAARSGFLSNYLIIESLQKFHHYYGIALKWNVPPGQADADAERGGGRTVTPLDALFLRDEAGRRPAPAPRRFSRATLIGAIDPVQRVFPRRQRPAWVPATRPAGRAGGKLIQQSGEG